MRSPQTVIALTASKCSDRHSIDGRTCGCPRSPRFSRGDDSHSLGTRRAASVSMMTTKAKNASGAVVRAKGEPRTASKVSAKAAAKDPAKLQARVAAKKAPKRASKKDLIARRNEYAAKFFPYIEKVARRLARRLPAHVEIDDLISSGVIGLMEAAERFDPSRVDRFEAFAEFRIRGAMLDDLRSRDTLSRDMRRLSNELRDATRRLEAQLGRTPDQEEIAAAPGRRRGRALCAPAEALRLLGGRHRRRGPRLARAHRRPDRRRSVRAGLAPRAADRLVPASARCPRRCSRCCRSTTATT